MWHSHRMKYYLAIRASQVGLVVKNPPANAADAGDVGLIPGMGRSPGEGNGNPLQYSCLENPMDRGSWQATQSMGSQKSPIRLSHRGHPPSWTELREVPSPHPVPLSRPVEPFSEIVLALPAILPPWGSEQLPPLWSRPLPGGGVCLCSVAQSCLTLSDPMDYNPSGSSLHGIPQARILQWVAISFSRECSHSRD